MKIIWSSLAKDYYLFIIDKLFIDWNVKIVEKFEAQTFDLIDKIAHHNHICPQAKIVNYHKCVLNKNVSLVYRINDGNLEIITFLFNKSNHLY